MINSVEKAGARGITVVEVEALAALPARGTTGAPYGTKYSPITKIGRFVPARMRSAQRT